MVPITVTAVSAVTGISKLAFSVRIALLFSVRIALLSLPVRIALLSLPVLLVLPPPVQLIRQVVESEVWVIVDGVVDVPLELFALVRQEQARIRRKVQLFALRLLHMDHIHIGRDRLANGALALLICALDAKKVQTRLLGISQKGETVGFSPPPPKKKKT